MYYTDTYYSVLLLTNVQKKKIADRTVTWNKTNALLPTGIYDIIIIIIIYITIINIHMYVYACICVQCCFVIIHRKTPLIGLRLLNTNLLTLETIVVFSAWFRTNKGQPRRNYIKRQTESNGRVHRTEEGKGEYVNVGVR